MKEVEKEQLFYESLIQFINAFLAENELTNNQVIGVLSCLTNDYINDQNE